MDIGGIFKGIGDFFGGIFGNKKKKEQDFENKSNGGGGGSWGPSDAAIAQSMERPVLRAPRFELDENLNPVKDVQNFEPIKFGFDDYGVRNSKPAPSFWDLLNPFGEHGLFGEKNRRTVNKTVLEPVNNAFERWDKGIDSSDDKEGFQWNDPGDYLRFVGKLPTGMAGGLVNAPEKALSAISGYRFKEDGTKEELSPIQRIATGLDAGIDVFGLATGGSGTLVKSAAKLGAKQALKQAGKAGIKQAIKNIGIDALKEGGEELAQAFLGDISDDGKLNSPIKNYADSFAMGALGGGIMSGVGGAVNKGRQMIDLKRQHAKIDAEINPIENPVQNAVAKMKIENEIIINRLSPSQMKYNVAEIMGAIHGDTRQRMGKAAFSDLQKAREYNPYTTGSGMDVELTRNGNRKMTRTSQKAPNEMFNVQQRLSPVIGEALAKSQQIDTSIDSKNHGFAKDGFTYHEVPVKYAGKDYNTVFDVGTTGNKNTVYNATTRKSPMEPAGTNPSTELHHLGDSHKSIIQQDSSDVKMKLMDNNEVDDYIEAQIKAQKDAKKKHPIRATKQFFSEKLPAAKERFKHLFIDDATAYEAKIREDIKAKKITKEDGKKLILDLRNKIDDVRASDMMAEQFIIDNKLSETIKGLSRKERQQFSQYLLAKRNVEDLSKRGIETGRDLDMDKRIVAEFGERFEPQEKAYRDYNKALTDFAAENGLLTPEIKELMDKNRDSYAPYYRVMDEVTGLGVGSDLANQPRERVIKKIKGSERVVRDPIESTMEQTFALFKEVKRNQAVKEIGEKLSYKRIGTKFANEATTISFLENGKRRNYVVPELVAEQFKRLEKTSPGTAKKFYEAAMNVAGMPAKLVRSGATALNAPFAISNLVRDQIQSVISGSARGNVKGVPQAFVATFSPFKKGKEYRAELKRAGIIGSEFRQTYGNKPGDLIRELRKQNSFGWRVIDKAVPTHWVSSIADLIGLTENFTRAQQYFGTEGDTVTKVQAARGNTLNFSRAGVITRQMNRIIPFLNAGVQGGRLNVKLFRERPVHTGVAIAGMVGVAAAARALSETQNKEVYDRIQDYEKETNLIITANAKYNPETGRIEGMLKIPMPQMLYPFLAAVRDFDGDPENLMQIAANLLGNGVEAATGINIDNPLSQFTAPAIKPFIESALNKNLFTGREIVSEWDKNALPQDQGKKYTSGAARDISAFLHNNFGFDIGAPHIDNLIGDWGGGLGRDLTRAFSNNPDNKRDGGGLNALGGGFGRRFLSASAMSQQQMAAEAAEKHKKDIAKDPNFANLKSDEKVKVLDAIDKDYLNIASKKARIERGEPKEKDNDLSARQNDLVKNNSNDYIDRAINGNRKTEKKQLYTQTDYEYFEFKKEYDKKKARGEYSKAGLVRAENKLKKLQAGISFTKDTRDAYDLKIEDIKKMAKEGEIDLDEVVKYGDALVGAGVAEKNKLRDKYGNIDLRSKEEKRAGARADRITKERLRLESQARIEAMKVKLPPAIKIPTMKLMEAVKAANMQKRGVSYRRVASGGRQIRRLNGGRILKRRR